VEVCRTESSARHLFKNASKNQLLPASIIRKALSSYLQDGCCISGCCVHVPSRRDLAEKGEGRKGKNNIVLFFGLSPFLERGLRVGKSLWNSSLYLTGQNGFTLLLLANEGGLYEKKSKHGWIQNMGVKGSANLFNKGP
jgi:hypothetical protein